MCADDCSRRKSPRLKGWDYSKRGIYFITICVHRYRCLLGKIHMGKMQLNAAGEMVQDVWLSLPEYNPGLIQDVFVVMPNHFHAVLGLVDPHIGRRQGSARTKLDVDSATGPADEPWIDKPLSVSDVVRKFKTLTMRDYRHGVIEGGWPRYDGHLWKRSYADHIIETERDLEVHRAYTFNNPLKWHLDKLNPDS